jgi:hypothetical protein
MSIQEEENTIIWQNYLRIVFDSLITYLLTSNEPSNSIIKLRITAVTLENTDS